MIKKTKNIKSIILLPICIILLLVVVNGTIAWLKSETNLLVSGFTYGNIKISIAEENSNNDNSKEYEIIPGTKLVKDTVVSVEAESEDCWLYVKIEQTENFDDYMSYALDEGWKKLEGISNVYYREVDKSQEVQKFNVMKDKVINVRSDLIKSDLDLLKEDTYPTLAISAYAIQRNKKMDEINTAEKAWLLVDSQEN